MRDNQATDEGKEGANKAPSSSVPADYPSRKRLFANSKPKQGSSAASSDSSLSSDSSSDRFRKKTRDLPNLSDCHSCGLRINNTNPKDKLQTLDSVWRIILICKKCTKRVQSAELCSYCFHETAENDCYRCPDCERCIHKDCVVKYRGFAPWSYCCSESGFLVCVDCWVPKLLANSNKVRVHKRRRNKVVSEPCLVGDSKVQVNGGGHKSPEDVVKDANFVVEEKIVVMAKENALRKAVVVKKAVESANGVLDLVAKKGDNGVKNRSFVSSSSASSTTVVDDTVMDDAELAFQLHRAMNSSPRISKNFCSTKSSFAVPNIWNCNGSLSARVSGSRGYPTCRGKLAVCTTKKLAEDLDKTVSEPSVCLSASDDGSCIDLDHLKPGDMIDMRFSTRDKECQENSEIGLDVDNIMKSESQFCRKQVELGLELHPEETSIQRHLKCDGNNNMLHYGRCDGNSDRYLIKYSKRHPGSNAISNCETKLSDRYLIKYSKRHHGSKTISNRETKFLYDGFLVENEAVAPAIPLNCSKESRAFSDANRCAVPMQASACGSGSSQDQS